MAGLKERVDLANELRLKILKFQDTVIALNLLPYKYKLVTTLSMTDAWASHYVQIVIESRTHHQHKQLPL